MLNQLKKELHFQYSHLPPTFRKTKTYSLSDQGSI